MKLKIMSFLVAMIAVVATLASCNFGGPGPDQSGSNIQGDDKYPWKSAEILVQLYGNDAKGELSSGLKRYYAGEDNAAFEEIDNLVRARNEMAEGKTKVDAKYSYDDQYGWGESTDAIQDLAKSGTAAAPDVYCNMAYDMTAIALRGCFANLLSNSSKSTNVYEGATNFFRFAEDDYVGTSKSYFDSNAGEGYFYDYMQSLSFANAQGKYDKMYCLASNYCTDLVRAFLVVPVNINLLNTISLESSTGDRDNDGDFDLEDFYTDVWENKWNYNALATLSNAVFQDGGKSGADLNDVLGFAAGMGSGLTGSGILYTTSVGIIDRDFNADGTWYYEYPETNPDLVALSNALAELFGDNAGKGICSISPDDAKEAGFNDGELKAIRERFALDKVLFGGVIAVGSLEDEVYQKMNDSLGFGIVPVPVYRDGDKYNTLVHNIARIISIGKATTEFSQCTAFLDYQSRNSAEILEQYYTEDLSSKVEGSAAGKHNKEMLKYIRNHVRDCFDKTYEDVISAYQKDKGDQDAMSNRWHSILYRNEYNVSNMDQMYDKMRPLKQGLLETVLEEWAELK